MDKITLPRQLARTQRFSLGLPRSFTLLPDGSGVLFLRTRGPEDRTGCLWLRDAAGERLLVDPSTLAGAAGELPEAERVRRERAREHSGGIVAYSADAAVRTVAFALDGTLWMLGLDGGRPARRLPTAGPVVDPRLDPTGHRVAYVTGGALHVVETTGADLAAAEPEHEDITYGLAEHVAAESMHRYRGYWWSPDGEHLLAARVDTTPVQRWWIGDPANPHRPPRAVPYPAAGTANADVSLHVLGLDGERTEVRWDRAGYEYLATAGWDAHGPLLGVQSRDQRTLRVLAADPDSGATRPLHEQRDPAWVQLIPGTPARTATGTLVHTADEGDTRRLTVDGEPVTPPGLQLRYVVSVDGESVLFVASDEPTEQHLWSYDPRAGGLRRISAEPGVHSGQRAGGTVLLESAVDGRRTFRLLMDGARPGAGRDGAGPEHAAPGSAGPDGARWDGAGPAGADPESTVPKGAGPRRVLPVASLAAEPVTPPRVTWLRAGERQLRTAVLLPSWYEPGGGPLPVLLKPYGGPAAQLVTRACGWAMAEGQWFADEGFAVVIADGRGTRGAARGGRRRCTATH